jgi:hypothetical protein
VKEREYEGREALNRFENERLIKFRVRRLLMYLRVLLIGGGRDIHGAQSRLWTFGVESWDPVLSQQGRATPHIKAARVEQIGGHG